MGITMNRIRGWIAATAIVALCVCGITARGELSLSGGTKESAGAGDPVRVVCENGVMLGRAEDGVISFKGVPYAKPPTGELRWKAPQTPDPGDGEIECYDFGYTALQTEWPTEQASYFPKDEDCLTLNIWENEAIADSEDPRPVMVFFHGGAYGWGGTTDPVYNGQNFAKAHDATIAWD